MQAAVPVHGDSVAFEGFCLRINILVGPLFRVGAVLNGSVFCGQAEGVPADGVQNIVAALLVVAGVHVSNGECLCMAHVQVA